MEFGIEEFLGPVHFIWLGCDIGIQLKVSLNFVENEVDLYIDIMLKLLKQMVTIWTLEEYDVNVR